MATAKKLPSGSWRCRVLVGTENIKQPDGTYKSKKVYKSFTCQDPSRKGKAEAERMAAEWLLSNKSNTAAKITLKDAMDKTLKIKSNTLKATTIRTYQSLIDTAYPLIIDKRIDRITKEDVQICMNDLAEKSSPKHCMNALAFLNSVMDYYSGTTFSPKLPQRKKPDTYTPTDAEVMKVIDHFKSDPELTKAIYLAAFGTLRRGEICGATAEDITGNVLHVHQSMIYDNGNWVLDTTKTEESSRYVQLPDFVINIMPKEGPLVSINPAQISNRFAKGLKKCDVKKFRFHDLRHYAASIMHAIGVPDQYIMAQGGWKTDGVLKRVYRDTLDDYMKQFAEKTASHFDEIMQKDATKDDTK